MKVTSLIYIIANHSHGYSGFAHFRIERIKKILKLCRLFSKI